MRETVEDLFVRWRRGESRALAAVFDRTAPEVWRVARHLTRDAASADDLVQATFVAAMESAARWSAGEPLLPWLLGILANKARMAQRRERRLQPGPREQPAPAPGTELAGDPAHAAAHGELRELLARRIDELPEPYRAVLALQLVNGLGAADIARALGRAHATVRSQLHRGLDLLRRSLPASLREYDEGRPGLRAVRGAVLAAAGVAPTAPFLGLGGAVMLKQSLIGAVVLAAVAMFWWPTGNAMAPAAAAPEPTTLVAAAASPLDSAQRTDGSAQRAAADAPATATGPTRLRVRVVWPDGQPAAAMDVWLKPQQQVDDWFAQRRATTGSDGIAVFDAAAGPVLVRASHGGKVAATVAAGATTDVELAIPAGIDARGLVVDADGHAVPAAIVAIGAALDAVLEVARCDGNGAFFLRALAPDTVVAAFAEGCAGSGTLRAQDFADGPRELRLGGAAGCVAGRVLDADGRPLAGAWVSHGFASEEGDPCDLSEAVGDPAAAVPAGPVGGPPAMRTVVTGDDGAFVLEGVPFGAPWPLHAGARDHAAWKGTVRAEREHRTFVEIRLQRAVTLRGTLRDASGAPTAGFVQVIDANAPGQNLTDERPSWATPLAATREDGAFAFLHLPAGSLLAAAHDRRGGSAIRTFSAQPGEHLSWEPMLRADRAIAGHVVDDVGGALAGWRVAARGDEGVPSPRDSETDADGAFELRGCADAHYTVFAFAPGNCWYEAIVAQRDVPAGGELLLRVGRDVRPSCFATGTLGDGEPEGLHVMMVGERGGLQARGPLQGGVPFEIGPVPPGRYSFQLQRETTIVAILGSCTLQPGQRHDLGILHAPPLAELAVDLVDASGQPVQDTELWLSLVGAPMGGVTVLIREGHGTASVPAGIYLPSSSTHGLCVEHPAFEITAGVRTAVHLEVARPVFRQVRFDLTALGVPQHAFANWKKVGVTLRRHTFEFWQERPVTLDEQFTPGTWELELELGTGAVHRFPFVVSSDDAAPPIEITVPR